MSILYSNELYRVVSEVGSGMFSVINQKTGLTEATSSRYNMALEMAMSWSYAYIDADDEGFRVMEIGVDESFD